ncbi:DUF4276 family protein [Sorangium sp. So ce513]|uniref:DUF4276 family protein n=1 Tax=Sorangium sp. So ce513 TaxID=3133315 RepID=UPI003F5E0C2D
MSAIGVLGEDETDCHTVAELIRRIVDAPVGRGVAIKRQYPPTGGCSMLRRKLASYARALVRDGCTAVIVVHDLDRNPSNGELNDINELRTRIERELAKIDDSVHRCICIPVEEIEAWFWSDQAVLDDVAKGHGKASISPHNICKPKELLRGLSAKAHRKAVYSTNENPRLARILDLDICAKYCESFRMLRTFVARHASY